MVPFLIVTILVFNSIESLAFLQRDFLKSKTNIIHASSIVVPRLSTEPDAVAPTNLDEKQVRPTYRDLIHVSNKFLIFNPCQHFHEHSLTSQWDI